MDFKTKAMYISQLITVLMGGYFAYNDDLCLTILACTALILNWISIVRFF